MLIHINRHPPFPYESMGSVNLLQDEDTFYLPAETGNYSVAGFEMVLNRKVGIILSVSMLEKSK